MEKENVLDAVNSLNSTLAKVQDFDVSELDLSERVLDNRIITLEGYLRFIENEGVPKIKRILDSFTLSTTVKDGDYLD